VYYTKQYDITTYTSKDNVHPTLLHAYTQSKHAIYFASFLEMELYIDSVENNMY